MDPVGNPLINSLRGVRVLRLVTISEVGSIPERRSYSDMDYSVLDCLLGFSSIQFGPSFRTYTWLLHLVSFLSLWEHQFLSL